ncbi:MAG TPA: Hsp20/alpha crystallin family protein [Chitinophagaceae bacterium]|jgi:HSP20 family protein|nr:Hsp20/alpha crystallin family protein [Chitinophagaceae bacterium]
MTTLVRRNNFFPAFNNFFDDFFSKDLFDWNDKNFTIHGGTLPSVNVKETEDDFKIELAAPGMKKEDFKVELDKHVLTISSEKKEEQEEKAGKYTRREFNYQSFSRSFTLPADVVESSKIAATYKDGILFITVPKKEAARPQPVKNIAVS